MRSMQWRKVAEDEKYDTVDIEQEERISMTEDIEDIWPNELGFSFPEDILEQRELVVHGRIPDYLRYVTLCVELEVGHR